MHQLTPILLAVCVGLLACGRAKAEDQQYSPQHLLSAEVLAEADMGMAVEEATDGPRAKVVTTGATFTLDKASGTIVCRQRIATERDVATLHLPAGVLRGAKLEHSTSGAAIFRSSEAVVRVNGDSLVMLQLTAGGEVRAELAFTPDFHNRFKGSFNFFDPLGGISFFEHGTEPPCVFSAAKDPVTVRWQVRAGEVLWAAVSPPKAFDWDQSVNLRVIVHGSSDDRYMYPSDLTIHRMKEALGATVLYLHNEVGWEHWQLSLVPRNRPEYQRVMQTAREKGLKTIVYASPHFFLKGTAQEATADKDEHKGHGTFTGHNAGEYLAQATRIVREFETDGLYFDEIYSNPKALATQYWLTRMSRRLVGDGPLFFHSTTDVLGDGHAGLTCPPLNAYFDVVYKGEGEWTRFEPGYTRYILGQHNTSNSIGVQITDDRYIPTARQIDYWLRHANVRFFMQHSMIHTGTAAVFREPYFLRLGPALRDELEPDLRKPTGVFRDFRQSIAEMGR